MKALVVLLLLLQDPKARVAEANDRLNRHVWEGRLELAEWCKSRGLVADAVLHYAYVRDRIAGNHPYKTKATSALSGAWKSKADSADAKARDEHAKKCDAYAMKAANLSLDVHRAAKAAKMEELAAQLLVATLDYHVDQPDARQSRGEVRLDAFGWVPKEEAEACRAAKQSEHFALFTDRDGAEAALARLEEVRGGVVHAFGDRFAWPAERIGLVWLKDADAFERWRARVPAGPGSGVVAFYSHLTHVAYVLADLGTLTHEAVHAVIDAGAGRLKSGLFANGRRADAPRDYWLVEGLACWFATLRVEDGRDTFRAGDVPADLDVAAFAKMGSTAFLSEGPRNYGIAQALVRRFLEGPKRDAFLDCVRDFYAGRGDAEKLLKD